MQPIADALAEQAFDEMSFYFVPQTVLFAALKLGVFQAMEGAAKDAEGVASATGCAPRGIRMLLDSMAAMGLVEKEGGKYALHRLARDYFLPTSANYLGALFLCSDELLKLWLKLPEAVKTGRPILPSLPKKRRERLSLNIVEALFQVHKAAAWKLAALVEKHFPFDRRDITILDVAAGSAVWSLPFALQSDSVEVTAVDFAPVLEVAKKFARAFGLEGRYVFSAGDIRKTDFGREKFDLALLGHICHSEGAQWSRRLIEKCFRALKKNGALLIMDYIADEERKSAEMPLLLALNALLGTEDGDTFTFSEYERWLSAAGFAAIATLPVGRGSPVIVATKK